METTLHESVVLLSEQLHVHIARCPRAEMLAALFIQHVEAGKGLWVLVILGAEVAHLHLVLWNQLAHALVSSYRLRFMLLHEMERVPLIASRRRRVLAPELERVDLVEDLLVYSVRVAAESRAKLQVRISEVAFPVEARVDQWLVHVGPHIANGMIRIVGGLGHLVVVVYYVSVSCYRRMAVDRGVAVASRQRILYPHLYVIRDVIRITLSRQAAARDIARNFIQMDLGDILVKEGEQVPRLPDRRNALKVLIWLAMRLEMVLVFAEQ